MSIDVEIGNLNLVSLKTASAFSVLQSKEKELDKRASGVNNPPTRSKKTPKRIIFKVWFNTYRYVTLAINKFVTTQIAPPRRFFVFTLGVNLIGLGLAAFGIWRYGNQSSSAIITANFNVAVLMRNEIFQRIIYLAVNILFAKVCCFILYIRKQ